MAPCFNRRRFLRQAFKAASACFTFSLIQSSHAHALPPPIDLNEFMQFSHILTQEENLNTDFGAVCWKYVQQHAQPNDLQAIRQFLADASLREKMLTENIALKGVAYHTLSVWYKGNLSNIPHTPEEAKIAYINALQWRAIGIPARGICVGNWSQLCTMS